MKAIMFPAALGALCAATTSAQQTELAFSFTQSAYTAAPGDTVTITMIAELLHPTGSLIATVADMGFNLSFGGTDLIIQNNNFFPAFDSDFFGPAVDGTVIGDSITNAFGSNTIPPLQNAAGTDASNPLQIYSFDIVIPQNPQESFYRVHKSDFELVGQVSGAYHGVPFPEVFNYQDALGNPGDVPWGFGGTFSDYIAGVRVIPAPASGLALLGLSTVAVRRRR